MYRRYPFAELFLLSMQSFYFGSVDDVSPEGIVSRLESGVER